MYSGCQVSSKSVQIYILRPLVTFSCAAAREGGGGSVGGRACLREVVVEYCPSHCFFQRNGRIPNGGGVLE